MTKAKQTKRGILSSTVVLFLQGWEGIILMFFALIAAFAGIIASPAFAGASLLAKEVFTFVISSVIFGRKNLPNIFKKGFTKLGFQYAIAFVIGSAIGTMFFMMAVIMAGPGYASILTAMYPIFTAIILKVFFKEKTLPVVWAGVILTIVGGSLFLALPTLLSGDFNATKLIGVSFGAITALCWSLEGILLNKIHKKDSKFNDKELSVWKSFVSLVFIIAVIMPITMAWDNSFTIFGNIMTTWQAIIIIIVMAFNLLTMRIFYTISIKNIGARRTSVIDTNNFLIGPLLSTILFYSMDLTYANSSDSIFEANIWWSWFLIIPILTGVLIVIINSKKHSDVLEHDR